MKVSSGPIGNFSDLTKPIHIVGAGFSGLIHAYNLKKAGYNVSIYENNKVGGKLQSSTSHHGLIEEAANAYFSSPEFDQLLQDLNLTPMWANKNLTKWIWLNSKATKPAKLKLLLKVCFSMFKKIDYKTLDSISVYDFFVPLLGKKDSYEVLSAIFGGVYAVDSKTLALKSLFKHESKAKNYYEFFKELKKLKLKNYKAQSFSFEDGVGSLITALKNELKENIKEEVVTILTDEANWIIATDAIQAARFFEESKIKNLLNQVEYSGITTSTFFTNTPVSFLENSFGLVIPPLPNIQTIGILHNSGIFNNRVTDSSNRSYTIISRNEISETQLMKEIAIFTNISKESILDYRIKHWSNGIPKYTVKKLNTILELRQEFLQLQNKMLVGNYIDGISLREILSNSLKMIKEMK